MRRLSGILLLAALLATPSGAASVEADLGILVARVEDNHGDDCAPHVASACLADAQTEGDPGNWTIDASQRVAYVGIASNLPLFDPGVDENSSGSDFYVRYPFLRQGTEAYHEIPQDRPHRDAAGLALNETMVGAYYYGPPPDAPAGPPRNQTAGLRYGDGRAGPGYEQAGPFNTGCCGNTDNATHADGIVCMYVDPASCATYRRDVGERYRGSAPQVVFGFTWEEVELATDPEGLDGPRASRRDDPAGGPGPRERAAPLHAGPRAQAPGASAAASTSEPDAPAPPQGAAAPAGPERAPARPLSTSGADAPRASRPLALAAVATAAALALALLAAALYSRFSTKEDLLASPARARIVELACARPGTTLLDLGAELALARTTLRYHVAYLERVRILRSVMVDGRQRVFPYGQAPREAKVSGRVQRLVFEALRAAPEGRTRAQLREALAGVPKPSRDEGIRTLLRRGVIVERDGALRVADPSG